MARSGRVLWGGRIGRAQRATSLALYPRAEELAAGGGSRLGHDRAMLNNITAPAPAAARRRVQAGLWMFFAGTVALLLGALARAADDAAIPAELAERFPAWPTWFVPESPAGYTAAVLLVCWGVWALGTGLRLARERSPDR